MLDQLKKHDTKRRIDRPGKRRAAWRQRLVDVERGMTHGVRADSSFFVFFFGGSIVVAGGFVLGLSLMQWTVIVLALTMVLSAEMFNQVVKALLHSIGHHFSRPAQKALRIGTAAVFAAMTGAVLCIALIFGQRLMTMFGN